METSKNTLHDTKVISGRRKGSGTCQTDGSGAVKDDVDVDVDVDDVLGDQSRIVYAQRRSYTTTREKKNSPIFISRIIRTSTRPWEF